MVIVHELPSPIRWTFPYFPWKNRVKRREVGHPRQLIEPDIGQIPKSHGGGIEQCTQDSRLYPLEVAPKPTLVAARLGLQVEEPQGTIEKVGPRGTQVGIALNTIGGAASNTASDRCKAPRHRKLSPGDRRQQPARLADGSGYLLRDMS